jgi:hypothetical protein
MNPPHTVRLGVVLLILSLVPGVIGFIGEMLVTGARAPGFVFAAVIVVASIALWSWIARKTWQGRPWARTLQTVLLPLGIAAGAISAARGTFVFTWDVPIVVLLSAAAVLMLWTPTGRRYFAETKAALHPPRPVKPYLDPKNR